MFQFALAYATEVLTEIELNSVKKLTGHAKRDCKPIHDVTRSDCVAANVQLLCARHNLKKRGQIE